MGAYNKNVYITSIGKKLLLSIWKSELFDGNEGDFDNNPDVWWRRIKKICLKGKWWEVYELLRCIVSVPQCPANLKKEINAILEHHRAAYRVIKNTLMPVASTEDATAVKENLSIANK